MAIYKDIEGFVKFLEGEIAFYNNPDIVFQPIAYGVSETLKNIYEQINAVPVANVKEIDA